MNIIKSVIIMCVLATVAFSEARYKVGDIGAFVQVSTESGGVDFVVFVDDSDMQPLVLLRTSLAIDSYNGDKSVVFQNDSDDDDYITVNAYDAFKSDNGDGYLYDISKDDRVISLFKRSSNVTIFFRNTKYGDAPEYIWGQHFVTTGFKENYNKVYNYTKTHKGK
jgi:hypothetical protein